MKNSNTITSKELTKQLAEVPEAVTTKTQLLNFIHMKKALNSIAKGKFTYTF